MTAKIILENVRCSYVYIMNPRKANDPTKPAKYGLQVIIEKSDKDQVKKIKLATRDVLNEAFGSDAWKKRARYKLPLRDGDAERDQEEYEGCYFFNASAGTKPGVVNKDGETADPDDLAEYCFSGAYFNVSLNFFDFPSSDGSKAGVGVGINNVMLVRKGDRLDGSTTAAKDFEDYIGKDFDDDDFDDDDFDDDDDL